MRRLLLLVPPILACSGLFQSEYAAYDAICTGPSTCTDCASASPSMRSQVLMKHISGLVSNSAGLEALDTLDTLALVAPESRGTFLRASAQGSGVPSCALADLFDKQSRLATANAICDVPSCKTFDRTDPATINACLTLDAATEEVGRMPKDPAALARAIDSFSRSAGLERCELVHALRTLAP